MRTIRPYYQDTYCVIYHGDARHIIPQLETVDAVITDPIWPNVPNDMFEITKRENPYKILESTLNLITSKRLSIIMRHDSDPRFLNCVDSDKWPYFRTAILPYVMPGYIGRKLGGDELAYCFGEPIEYKEGQKVIPGRAPLAQPDNRAANGHPCSRALTHINWLVRWYSNESDTILDPFAGSCTTARAAKDLNRKCIRIEIEEKYCEIAVRLLKQEVLPFKWSRRNAQNKN